MTYQGYIPFVKDIKNNQPDPKIKSSVPVLTVGSSIRWAYGFSNLVGISTALDIAYGETHTRGENGLALVAWELNLLT